MDRSILVLSEARVALSTLSHSASMLLTLSAGSIATLLLALRGRVGLVATGGAVGGAPASGRIFSRTAVLSRVSESTSSFFSWRLPLDPCISFLILEDSSLMVFYAAFHNADQYWICASTATMPDAFLL